MARVFVLWDDSHLWGVLVLRALRALGTPHQILRAHDIAEGALSGKSGDSAPVPGSDAPALLIVPGGWARGRALRLGPGGMAAIRAFVDAGGSYLGFCGGAGLALTGPKPEDSLGLCPWGRMGFAGRLQHFLSGTVRLDCDAGSALCPPSMPTLASSTLTAPVWWPAQFAPARTGGGEGAGDGVEVLARYAGLGKDFWVGDLDLSLLPEETLADWENLYGLQIRPDFLVGRPAVISGRYGAGRYVLSYPHLETPDSPEANAWLAHLLRELGGDASQPNGPQASPPTVPPWQVGQGAPRWPDATLLAAKAAVERAIAVGESHLLLFWRNPWLMGWRRGLPGPGINSLYALLCEALAAAPTPEAEAYWAARAPEFARLAELFRSGLSGLLLAERLDMTVRQTPAPAFQTGDAVAPDQIFAVSLRETRRALFGTPPAIGGVCGELLAMLEELCARLWGSGCDDSS